MKIKSLLALTLGIAASAPAMAYSDYLHIRTASGWEVLDLAEVDRLTFSNGVMTASDKDLKPVATFEQAALVQMYVSDTSGVTLVGSEDATAATFQWNASEKCAHLLADGALQIYALDGTLLHEVEGVKAGETVSLAGMGSDKVVVVRVGNYSLKAILK